ncbi:transposase [Streptomyces sp. NPDC057074]|uniref:transposase n=1 Tax=Streptomyces sp. NPDC057074 TaxID=3346015 RepID=UPI003638FA9D
MGDSCTGKTRAAYEAIKDIVPGEFQLLFPTDAKSLLGVLEADALPAGTVLWLNEMQNYLDNELGEAVAAALLRRLDGSGPLPVLATLWTHLDPTRIMDRNSRVTDQLAQAVRIHVPKDFSDDLQVARTTAQEADDASLDEALATGSSLLTQTLAAGPDLVEVYEHPQRLPGKWAKALISVGMDAHRLGHIDILRPGIEVVCRDRAPFFAEGATAGAPQAVQVADRWHLWNNLGEATERAVARHRQCLRVLVPEPVGQRTEESPEETPDSPWQSQRFANRIRARHATVHAMLEAGHSRRAIGRQLHMTHRTVKSLADAARPEDLFRGQWQYNRTSALDEYKPYLDKRWDEGCTNAWKLWEEIIPLGYQGSYGIVSAYLRKKRTSPRPVTAQPPAPRAVTRWILSRPETLTELEQLRLKAVLAECPELNALAGHVRSFARMLTERQGERLPQWLDAVRQNELPSLHSLAAGIDRDRAAVIAGLTLPWSSGVVEGHVNRIKMLKRQMFGRAGFDLLRKRVLLYT